MIEPIHKAKNCSGEIVRSNLALGKSPSENKNKRYQNVKSRVYDAKYSKMPVYRNRIENKKPQEKVLLKRSCIAKNRKLASNNEVDMSLRESNNTAISVDTAPSPK